MQSSPSTGCSWIKCRALCTEAAARSVCLARNWPQAPLPHHAPRQRALPARRGGCSSAAAGGAAPGSALRSRPAVPAASVSRGAHPIAFSSLFFPPPCKRESRIGPVRQGCCCGSLPPSGGCSSAGPRRLRAPVSLQRYLKGLVDISRVGWAVWVGFPVLEVSCSPSLARPSLPPGSRSARAGGSPHPAGALLSGRIYIVMCKLQDAQQHWKEI